MNMLQKYLISKFCQTIRDKIYFVIRDCFAVGDTMIRE